MAAASKKWKRYVLASIASHLKTAAAAESLLLAVDGLDDKTREFVEAPHRAEVNITGPHSRELTPKEHRIHVEVFCVVTSQVGGANANAGDHSDKAGAIHSALDRAIPIFNYEPGNDSPTQIGCITPRNEPGDQITVSQLRGSDTDKLVHSVIEARFVGYLQQ